MIVASSTIIRLKPSTPVVKLSRQSGNIVNEVTCWKSRWPYPKEPNRNRAAANISADAANAVLRAGAPTRIKTAAAIGQKMTNKTIRENDKILMTNDEGLTKH